MNNKFTERDNNDFCVIVNQIVRLQVASHVVLIRQCWRAIFARKKEDRGFHCKGPELRGQL